MNQRPPQPSLFGRMLTRAINRASRLRPAAVHAIVLVGMVAALAADHYSGVRTTMIVLYLLVAGFAAWCLGERSGLVVGLLTCIGGALIKHGQLREAGIAMSPATEGWNALARLLSTTLLVIVASSLKSMIALERWRASTDGLTGALNKMAFQERMATRIADAQRSGACLVLCYMDLDGFKQVNDRHGHAAGDRVLRIFSEGAEAMMRREDLFARIGGDEFVALLAVPSPDEGDRMAEMMHARLTAVLGATALEVTCSMGALVAKGPAMAQHPDFMATADMLMYEVKRAGKNALRIGRLLPPGANDDRPPVGHRAQARQAA